MKLEMTLCTALAALALGIGAVQAQDDRRVSADAERDDLMLTERREELLREADEAIDQLRRENESAAELLDAAYGHAVFHTTKGGLILTGAGGTGVARANDGTDVTFMRLGAAGIGLGAGLENYKLIMVIADEDTYSRFVSGQWDGAFSGQAAAGSEGVSTEEQFIGGVRAFRLTDGGLIAQLDATALRFWPVDRLNRAVEIEERIAAASGGEVPEAIEESLASPAAEPESSVAAARATEPEPEPAPSNPEWLDEIAAEHEDIGLFVDAVRAAGLANALTGSTEYTVFAPTNDAFESSSGMTREELLAPENREELVRLLRAHIVADDLDREMAGNIPEALTIDGGTVAVDVEGDEFTVGDASVVEPDIRRGNLRVHVVDGLLAPPIQVAEAPDVTTEQESAPEAAPADSGPAPADPETAPANPEAEPTDEPLPETPRER